jgi:hypothetical protein
MRTSLVRFLVRRTCLAAAFIGALAGFTSTATTVVEPSFDELVNQSDYIIRGVVKSVVPEKRQLPNGSHTIFSKVEIEVRDVVAGTVPTKVVLEVLGGTLEGRELSIEGAPKFTVGQEAIYFVQGNGAQIFPLVRMMHGFYPVEKDAGGREYVVRSNGSPLIDVQAPAEAKTGPTATRSEQIAHALSPTDFITKIRAAAHETHLLQHAQR